MLRSTSYFTVSANPFPVPTGGAKNFSITNFGATDLLYASNQNDLPAVLIPAGMSQTFRDVPYQKVLYLSTTGVGTILVLFISW